MHCCRNDGGDTEQQSPDHESRSHIGMDEARDHNSLKALRQSRSKDHQPANSRAFGRAAKESIPGRLSL